MPIVTINYVAVLVSALVAYGIGALWYSQIGFGKPWMALMGISVNTNDPAVKKQAMKSMMIGFIPTLVMAYILAHFVDYVGAVTVWDGITLAFWIWLGFIGTVQLGQILWERKPFKLYAINTTHYLVSVAAMAIILARWS